MFILLFCLIFILNCSTVTEPQTPNSSETESSLFLQFSFKPLFNQKKSVSQNSSTEHIDSIEIYITSPETPFYHTSMFFDNQKPLNLTKVPTGEKIIVEINLYDSSNTILYHCYQSNVNILAGEDNTLQISCTPKFSNLEGVFNLGVNNPYNITEGVLSLSNINNTYSKNLEVKGEIGYFFIDNIKG